MLRERKGGGEERRGGRSEEVASWGHLLASGAVGGRGVRRWGRVRWRGEDYGGGDERDGEAMGHMKEESERLKRIRRPHSDVAKVLQCSTT